MHAYSVEHQMRSFDEYTIEAQIYSIDADQ